MSTNTTDTNNNNNKEKPKGRRSSLKSQDCKQLDANELLKLKNKRNSVSWGQTNTFQFKAMKAMFQEVNDINRPRKNTEQHKHFLENRKKSIKNEFSIVKEMMKNNKDLMEEDNVDDEVKQNTDKNLKIGKEGVSEESDSSNSSDKESEEEKEK